MLAGRIAERDNLVCVRQAVFEPRFLSLLLRWLVVLGSVALLLVNCNLQPLALTYSKPRRRIHLMGFALPAISLDATVRLNEYRLEIKRAFLKSNSVSRIEAPK